MPPRFTYWTIIFGGQPTAFRSGSRDELLPTFKQIQARHPDAQLRYFARGKLWFSEEEAQAALVRARSEKNRRPASGPRLGPPKPRSGGLGPPKPRSGEGGRGRDWRPGGEHKDPRDRFKVPRDVKRARFKARLPFKKPPAGSREPEAESRKPEAGSWKPRADSRQPRADSPQPRADSRKPGAGSWKPSAGSRKPDAGGWKRPQRPPGAPRNGGLGPPRNGGLGPPKRRSREGGFKKKDEE